MRCRYRKTIFQNEENGYTIAVFTTKDASVPLAARDKYLQGQKVIGFTAIGFDLPQSDQIEIEMEGQWEKSSHGLQYQVENFMEIVPRTKEGILGYLSCGSVKGVGPRVAEAIFKEFGLNTLEIMEEHPQELLKVKGISQKKLKGIVESYGKNKVFRELMTFLAPYKVTPKKVNLILQRFRNESVEIVRRRPYQLCAVKGFGFLTVDAIGRQNCQALNDPMRISGCISHLMESAMKEEGHLYLERPELIQRAYTMLNQDLPHQAVTEMDIQRVLYRLVMQESIVVDGERVYVKKQYEEENQTGESRREFLYTLNLVLSYKFVTVIGYHAFEVEVGHMLLYFVQCVVGSHSLFLRRELCVSRIDVVCHFRSPSHCCNGVFLGDLRKIIERHLVIDVISPSYAVVIMLY